MKIITDTSTLYAPNENDKITVLPLSVTINNETYKEYVDISSDDFLELVRQGGIPTSSQPSIGEALEVFEQYDHEELIVLSMADGLSGTYQSMLSAKHSMKNNENIHVINTKTLCGPHRYLVQKAIELKEKGTSVSDMLKELQACIDSSISFLIPSDFNFLKRGGRLTPLAATIGGMVKIVPITMQTKDGKRLEKFAIKRTFKNAVQEILKYFESKGINEEYVISISHADALDKVQCVIQMVKEKFHNIRIDILELSPAFIAQGGPGCVAIQVIKQ